MESGDAKKKDKEVALTYDTIFELLRREKNRPDLQTMPDNFFMNAHDYVKEKKSFATKGAQSSNEMFGSEESEKTKLELINIIKMLRNIYNLRETKILSMAVNKARVESSIINTSALLPEEKMLYKETTDSLKRFRTDLLNSVIEGKEIDSKRIEMVKAESEIGEFKHGFEDHLKENHGSEAVSSEESAISEPESQNFADVKGGIGAVSEEADFDEPAKKIMFLTEVAKFIGPELEFYGPFKEGDMAELPIAIANIVVSQGKAKEV